MIWILQSLGILLLIVTAKPRHTRIHLILPGGTSNASVTALTNYPVNLKALSCYGASSEAFPS
jgi:hypothetical protein